MAALPAPTEAGCRPERRDIARIAPVLDHRVGALDPGGEHEVARRADTRGQVWLLDMGARSGITPKFVIWDCHSDTLAQVIALPQSALVPHSETNDFALDERHATVYIADEAAGNGGDGSTAATDQRRR